MLLNGTKLNVGLCVCCSCGTLGQTIRGLCRHLWVTPALCAAFTSRVID